MNIRYQPLKSMVTVALMGMLSTATYALESEDLSAYCKEKGGSVQDMTALYQTSSGSVSGWTDTFCTFERDNGYIVIGLKTFASPKSNIAATYMKNLGDIAEGSPLMKGPTGANPSYNVCKNLGGTAIGFAVSGHFKPNEGGESDICVFGDGSMVSGWSLIYMANHRTGYDIIKAQVNSKPLNITMP